MRIVLLPFLLSRLLIVSLFICVRGTIFIQEPATVIQHMNPELRLSLSRAAENLSQALLQSDVNWYLSIVANGYAGPPFNPMVQQNWAFCPGWAGVLWLLNLLTGHPVLFGFLVSNILFFFSLYFIVRLCKSDNLSEQVASTTVWLLCFCPLSYFFSVPMSESFFLFVTSGSLLALQSNRPLLSALAFSISTATRPTGVLLLPAYFTRLLKAQTLSRSMKLGCAIIAPLGMVAFMAYMWMHLGDPLAFIKGHQAWERGQQGFVGLLNEIANDPWRALKPWNFIWLNIAAAVLCIGASKYWALKQRYDFWLYCLLPIIAALLSGSVLSIGRIALALFPVFIALGIWAKTRERELSLIAVFAVLLTIMCVFFARGGNVALT